MVGVCERAFEAGHLANEDMMLCSVCFVKVCCCDVKVTNGPVFGGGDCVDRTDCSAVSHKRGCLVRVITYARFHTIAPDRASSFVLHVGVGGLFCIDKLS